MKNHCRPLRAYLIWGASAAAVVSALGAQAAVLGHSRVISAPNEPLRIAVQLKDLSPEEIDSLTATIAPTSAWHEAGLQAPVDLSSFRLITAAAAQPNAVQLILESSQVANQPVIDVLVDIETQVSKQRHQVSVLQAPLPAPVVLTQIADVGSQSPLAPTTASPTTTARSVTKASIHRVQSGQTLSHIARRYRSDRYSDQQFMAALLELNPQAFIHGNLHLVRAGASLTIPNAEAVAAISPEQAQQIYQTHLRWFNDYKQGLAQGQPLQPLVTLSSATTQTGSVPLPSNSTPVASSTSTAEPAASTDRLELAAEETQSEQSDQQMALAQDLAYSAQRLAEIEAPTLNETVLSSTDSSTQNTQNQNSSEASARAQSTVMPESMVATPNTEVGEGESGAKGTSESQSWVQTYLGWALALLILVVLSITWFLRRSNTSRLDVLDELTPSAARMRDKLEKNNDNFAPQTDEVEFREIK